MATCIVALSNLQELLVQPDHDRNLSSPRRPLDGRGIVAATRTSTAAHIYC